jgi:hypothetical protein
MAADAAHPPITISQDLCSLPCVAQSRCGGAAAMLVAVVLSALSSPQPAAPPPALLAPT